MNMYKFGNYICKLREEKNLTQAELLCFYIHFHKTPLHPDENKCIQNLTILQLPNQEYFIYSDSM